MDDIEKNARAKVEIAKSDDDKRLVFGWASIAVENGEQLEDIQHDVIDPEDLEEAAYEYVLNFRDTGEEHMPGFRKKGKLVESCVFTEEKQQAMGLAPGSLPIGWWIGFYIEDDDAWERIKNGTYRMFSIEGRAERVPMDDVTKGAVFDCIEEIEKFNPYHDRLGRFTSAGGATSFTIRTRAGYQQGMADKTIAREKEKMNIGGGKPLRNPSGNLENDRKREWKGADYAVQFKNNGTRYGVIDLHSNKRTGKNGEYSWAENAYDNAKNFTRSGNASHVYMIDRKNAIEAERSVNQKIKERNIKDSNEAVRMFHEEIQRRSLRSIDQEYARDQHEKRQQRENSLRKSCYDLIEEVNKFNPYHGPDGRFTTASSAASFTIRTRAGWQQGLADLAISREKNKWQKSQSQKIEYEPAKTKKAAVEYAKNNLGFKSVNYGKMSIETINHVNGEITKIQSKYPETKGAVHNLKFADDLPDDVVARTRLDTKTGNVSLMFNAKDYGQGLDYVESFYKNGVDKGYFPKGTNYQSIVWHEYGHVLAHVTRKQNAGLEPDGLFPKNDIGPRVNVYRDSSNHSTEKKWVDDAAKSLGIDADDIGKRISKYAGEKRSEAVAEAFSEVNTSKNPRKEAVEVVKASGWYRN